MPLSPPGDHTFGRSAHGKTVYSMAKLRAFLRDNSILVLAALCAAGSMVLVPPDGEYIDYVNWQVLGILFCLMAAVDGLAAAGCSGACPAYCCGGWPGSGGWLWAWCGFAFLPRPW